MARFIFAILALAIISVNAGKIQPRIIPLNGDASATPKVDDFRDCGSSGTVVAITMTGCTATPCVATPFNDYEMEVTFTAGGNSDALHLTIYGITPDGTVPIVDTPVTGSITEGQTYSLAATISSTDYFLDTPLELEFHLVDSSLDRVEVCTAFDAAVRVADIAQRVTFDMTIGGESIGQIVLGMFNSTVPRTVANFVTICESGLPSGGQSYTGSIFHRVIRNFMAQGGDVIYGDGTGGGSIYGPSFDDENFDIKHRAPGYISMANAGPNTNGCQFFITTVTTAWLDGAHVAFGSVLKGMDVVRIIEATPTNSNDRPLQPVMINQCSVA